MFIYNKLRSYMLNITACEWNIYSQKTEKGFCPYDDEKILHLRLG